MNVFILNGAVNDRTLEGVNRYVGVYKIRGVCTSRLVFKVLFSEWKEKGIRLRTPFSILSNDQAGRSEAECAAPIQVDHFQEHA